MGEVRITINKRGLLVPEGTLLIEAALRNGIYIPHLCHHPDLPPSGECGLCVVKVEGMGEPVTACTLEVSEGMVVQTESEELKALRLKALKRILEGHPPDCSTCPKYLNCELQALKQYLGYSEEPSGRPRAFPLNEENPLFVHDPTRCVLCKRCIRACRDLRGVGVLEVRERDGQPFVYTRSGKPLAEEGCMFCGACVEVCPTGALRDREELVKGRRRKEALLPCKASCPAGIDVPGYLRAIRRGQLEEALRIIEDKAPLVEVLGYVCPRPCEDSCRRGMVNEAVAIRLLKRFVGEKIVDPLPQRADRGTKVAIVGSGPAGLSAAFFLARLGHSVTVLEAMEEPGGMLRYGIPSYRLPREVLKRAIRRIEALGVEILTGRPVMELEPLRGSFDAVLLALGAQEGIKPGLKGVDLQGVLVGLDFLMRANKGEDFPLGERVAVVGGGSVAMDCAIVAKLRGAREVFVLCIEPREAMPALREEREEAEAMGVRILPCRAVTELLGNGRVEALIHEGVEAFSFDQKGGLSLSLRQDGERLEVDAVIFAVGQRPKVPEGFEMAVDEKGRLEVDPFDMMTEREGVFACGDVVTGTKTVVEAVAAGRRAADAIDRYLGGDGVGTEDLPPISPKLEPIPGFACLGRIRKGRTDPVSVEEAMEEARRCLQCDLRLGITPPRFWGDYGGPR